MPTMVVDTTKIYNDTQIEAVHGAILQSIKKLARAWETEAKRIVMDESFDTGEFAASIHYEIFEDGDQIGFVGSDGVKYGIYIEKGTVKHFVPFYKWTGAGYDVGEPILADWGHRVLGLSKEEMLKMGGLQVSTDDIRPFMRAMLYTQSIAPDIFKKTFKGIK